MHRRTKRLTASLVTSLAFGSATLTSAQSIHWISQFGTTEQETGTQVAASGSGGVFAATNSGPQIFGTTDVILAGYDAAGQQVWTRTIGSTGRDEVWDAAEDGSGGFLACGSTSGSLGGALVGLFDGWIGRFDAAGTEIWLTQFGSTQFDSCFAVTSDGAGGAFACGRTQGDLAGTSSGTSDVWVARFDATGSVTWIRQFDSGFAETATDVVRDGTGGAYICGTSSGDLFGFTAGDADAWLARLDGSGNTLWGLQWGSGEPELSVRVALNGTSGVFVGGGTSGLLGASNAGEGDVWLTRVSEAGTQSWIRQFGTPVNDQCTALASDLAGGFYVAGSTNGMLGTSASAGLDPWVARYDDSGERTWLRQFGTAGVDRSNGLSVSQPGQFFLGGSTALDLAGVNEGQEDAWIANIDSLLLTNYCSTPANSSGASAVISASGSSAAAINRLSVRCESMPRLVFGYFLVSSEQGFVGNPAGSQGNLCLAGSIGRFVGPGQVQNSGLDGVIDLVVDPSALPQPLGPVAVQPGETWNFQAWFRDGNPQATSNFSNGIEVMFL